MATSKTAKSPSRRRACAPASRERVYLIAS